MLDHDVAKSTRRALMPKRVLLTASIAIGLVGAMVGVAAGRTSPATEHKQLAPAAVAPTYVYIPVTPNRLVDSRYNVGLTGPLKSRVARTFQVTNRNPSNPALNIPNSAVGVTGNLTVDKQTAYGYLSLTPAPTNAPTTSTLNFPHRRHARQLCPGRPGRGRQAERHVRRATLDLDHARRL